MATTHKKTCLCYMQHLSEYESHYAQSSQPCLKAHESISPLTLGYFEKFSVRFDGSSERYEFLSANHFSITPALN